MTQIIPNQEFKITVLKSEEQYNREVSGFYLDPDFDPDEHVVKRFEVVTPHKNSSLKPGDFVWTHRFVGMHQKGFFGDDTLYWASEEQIYCVEKEDGTLEPYWKWNILNPVIKERKKKGFQEVADWINPSAGEKDGTIYLFQLDSNKEYTIGEKTIYFVEDRFILGTYKDGTISPKDGCVYLEASEQNKDGFLVKTATYNVILSSVEDIDKGDKIIFKKKSFNTVKADRMYIVCQENQIYGKII